MAFRDGRKKSWFYIENDIIDRTDLDKNEKYLYMVLARYVDKEDKAFPSYSELAEKSGLGRTTIIKAIKSLEEKGLIIKVNRKKENSKENYSNLYTLKSAKLRNIPEENEDNQDESIHLGGSPSELRGTSGEPGGASDELGGAPSGREQYSLNNTSTNNIPHDSREDESQTQFDQEIVVLTNLLIKFIKKNNDRQPAPDIDLDDKKYITWIKEIDKLNRIGPPGGSKGYSFSEIKELILWSQTDPFWSSNILSASKLRKQAPKLELQMKNTKNPKGGVNHEKNGNVRRRDEPSLQEKIARESEKGDYETTEEVDF